MGISTKRSWLAINCCRASEVNCSLRAFSSEVYHSCHEAMPRDLGVAESKVRPPERLPV